MARLEKQERAVIAYMRAAIATIDRKVDMGRNYQKAHDLFGDHLCAWSESFARLYDEMLAIWRTYTPKKNYIAHQTSREIGYTGYPITRYTLAPPEQQPTRPTVTELLERFDVAISAYDAAKHPIQAQLKEVA